MLKDQLKLIKCNVFCDLDPSPDRTDFKLPTSLRVTEKLLKNQSPLLIVHIHAERHGDLQAGKCRCGKATFSPQFSFDFVFQEVLVNMNSKTNLHFPLARYQRSGHIQPGLMLVSKQGRLEWTMAWRPHSPLPHGLEKLQRILELLCLQVLTPAVNLAMTALRGRARRATATARCLSGRVSILPHACPLHPEPLRKKLCFPHPHFTNRCGCVL